MCDWQYGTSNMLNVEKILSADIKCYKYCTYTSRHKRALNIKTNRCNVESLLNQMAVHGGVVIHV